MTRSLILSLSLLLASATTALAQPQWIVVPVRTTGTDPSALTAPLERALAASGDRVLGGADASRRFENVHSADAATVAPSDIELWATRSRTALRHLARAEYTEARRALLEAQAISERAAEAMNREAARARGVLDTCLMVVRAHIETGDEAAALEQARACRRLVPRMQATAYTHPPEVRELLTRVDAEPTNVVFGMLRVESTPSGCPVRVNGVAFGNTPVATNELGAGEYRVQVECRGDVPGRVRRVVVGPTDVFVRVDTRFDEALRSRGGLSFEYDGPQSAEAHAIQDGGLLSSSLGVHVLLVRVLPSGEIRLDAVAPSGVRSVTVARADAIDRPELVVTRIAQATVHEAEVAEEADGADAEDELERPRAPLPRGRRIAGLTLLGVGGAGLLAGIALDIRRESLGSRYRVALPADPDFLDRQVAWSKLRAPLLALSTTGSALTATSIVLLASHHRRLPWWAWTAGGVGVGLTALAVVSGVSTPACDGSAQDVPDCVARETSIDRAALIASLASPLLTTPFALRFRREASISVTAGPGQAAFSIQGTLQ